MQLPEQKICELDYIPARITEGKEWFVSFYAFNPVKGRLDRKKIKINRIKSVSLRREMGRKLVIKLNDQLKRGWNPFIEEEASKAYHKLFDVLKTYTNIIRKEREENSIRSYLSFLEFLKRYITNELKDENMYVYKFTDNMASDMMLYINALPNISVRTYNNYLSFYRLLFNWMIQFKYKKTNPFSGIKKKEEPKTKNRAPIPYIVRQKLREYFILENPNFLTMMLIEYYCLLRPKEISYLKIKDIDLKHQFIIVDGSEAKNDNRSYRTIPPMLMPYLKNINLTGNPEHYVFSDDKPYKFEPGIKHMDPRKISKYWSKLREKFGFGLEIKFYSLKDTGIIDLLEAGVSIEDVRDQADHHDISVTAVYARHAKPKGSDQIRDKARKF